MKTWMLGAALLSAGCSLWHSTDRDRDSSPSKPGMTDAGGDGDESDAAEPPQPPDAQVLPDAGPAEHDADVPTGPDGCVAQEVYEDYDGDGHGNALRVRLLCDVPEGWSLSSNDCDDQDPAVWKETELGCIPPGPLSCKYKEPYCDPLSTCFDEGNEGRCICPGTHVDVASDGSDCRPAFRDAMSFGQFESDDRLLDLTRDAQGNLWMASEVWGKTWLGNQLVGGEHFTTVLGKFSPDLDVLYAQSFEGPVSFASLAVDENGDLWWAGLFDGTANFGGATHTAPSGRAFVARRHPDGSHAFSTAFAGEGNSAAYALATRGDSLFVAGSFAGTINLSNDEAPEAELVSQGGQDVFVAELDLAGNHRWSTSFGGAGDEFPRALSAGPEGLSVLVDFTRELTLEGKVYATGGKPDAFSCLLARFDEHRNLSHASGFVLAPSPDDPNSYPSACLGYDLLHDRAGGLWLTGYHHRGFSVDGTSVGVVGESLNMFLLKFTADHRLTVARTLGAVGGLAVGESLAQGPGQTVWLAGKSRFATQLADPGQPYPALPAGFVAVGQFDAQGRHLRSMTFGNERDGFVFRIASDGASRLYLAGGFPGSLSFDGVQTLWGDGAYRDIFLSSFQF